MYRKILLAGKNTFVRCSQVLKFHTIIESYSLIFYMKSVNITYLDIYYASVNRNAKTLGFPDKNLPFDIDLKKKNVNTPKR